MVNLQLKAHAQHVVQPFSESVEDKFLTGEIQNCHSSVRPFHSERIGDGSFSISSVILFFNGFHA
jgi:hypothetical protein